VTLRDLLASAERGVRLHRWRSALTAAGFAAGTAAAVALFAIAGGARLEILEQIRALGAGFVTVRAIGGGRGLEPPLTFGDAEALATSFPFVADVAPVAVLARSVLLPDESVAVRVLATTPEFFALRGARFERGRPFSREEAASGRNVCVLGAEAARRIVPAGAAYGTLVKVGGNWYRVVGVLARSSGGESSSSDTEGQGREVFVPIATVLQTAGLNPQEALRDEGRGRTPVGETVWGGASGRRSLREILLRIDDEVDPDAGRDVLERALLRRHAGRKHFEVLTAEDLLHRGRAARGVLDVLLGSVATAAFFLGGIAMATLSWQSVRERTREIAIRRAVGARRSEIVAQFLLEGAAIAVGGAAAGTVLGSLGSLAAARAGGFPWTIGAGECIVAAAIAVAIGLAASLHPALRAAAVDPVAALRFEG
jgi:putative ABC transport system permease protein